MTWCCTRLEDVNEHGQEAHVHPDYEEHIISATCWCGPRRLDDVEHFAIWLHRDRLDREGPDDPVTRIGQVGRAAAASQLSGMLDRVFDRAERMDREGR